MKRRDSLNENQEDILLILNSLPDQIRVLSFYFDSKKELIHMVSYDSRHNKVVDAYGSGEVSEFEIEVLRPMTWIIRKFRLKRNPNVFFGSVDDILDVFDENEG